MRDVPLGSVFGLTRAAWAGVPAAALTSVALIFTLARYRPSHPALMIFHPGIKYGIPR